MKKLCVIFFILLAVALRANAVTYTSTPFVPGASSVANIKSGTIDNTAIGNTTPSTGKFTSMSASSVAITGGTIDNATIGNTTPSTGKFTSVMAASGISIVGASGVLSIPSGSASSPSLTIGVNPSAGFYSPFAGGIYSGIGLNIISFPTVYIKTLGNGVTGNTLVSATAPTIASGFGTSPVITANGTASFTVNVGAGGTASTGTLTFPAMSTAPNCSISNPMAAAGTFTQQSAQTTTSVTFTNYTSATLTPVAWPASYVLRVICLGM